MPSETPAQTACKALHAAWEAATGMPIRWSMERERQWLPVHSLGYTPADVAELVKHYRKGIAEGKRNLGALKLENFTVKFEDDLVLYRMTKPAPAERGVVSSKTPTLPRPQATPLTPEEIRSMRREAGLSNDYEN